MMPWRSSLVGRHVGYLGSNDDVVACLPTYVHAAELCYFELVKENLFSQSCRTQVDGRATAFS